MLWPSSLAATTPLTPSDVTVILSFISLALCLRIFCRSLCPSATRFVHRVYLLLYYVLDGLSPTVNTLIVSTISNQVKQLPFILEDPLTFFWAASTFSTPLFSFPFRSYPRIFPRPSFLFPIFALNGAWLHIPKMQRHSLYLFSFSFHGLPLDHFWIPPFFFLHSVLPDIDTLVSPLKKKTSLEDFFHSLRWYT